MTDKQTANKETEQHPGVILSERFLHRDDIVAGENWFFLANTDEILVRLAEHFALTPFDLKEITESLAVTDSTTEEEMPRFQQSHRDGLHVPKEGQDGTGN